MSDSWFNEGFEGISNEERRLEESQGPQRLWMPSSASKDVVWIDEIPVCIYEHNPKMNSNYRNWLTCQQGVYDEVVCCQKLGPDSRYYCGYLTVVDCSEWKDARGNTHNYEMRLIQLKLRSLKKFRRKKEDRGAMLSTLWRLTREDDNAPVCGDDWEFQRDVDMSKMFDHVNYRGRKIAEMWDAAEADPEAMARVLRVFRIKPDSDGKLPRVVPSFNYLEVLKPKAPKEMRLHLGAVEKDEEESKGSPRSFGGGAAHEEEVPF